MAERKKMIWTALGWIAAVLAIVGIFLPIVPQIPFAVLAAYCFSKGSPRLHHWILNNRHFGAAVRDWELDQVIRVRTKVASIAMMIFGAGFAYWKYAEEKPYLGFGIPVLFALAVIFVATRRSRTRANPPPTFEGRPPMSSIPD